MEGKALSFTAFLKSYFVYFVNCSLNCNRRKGFINFRKEEYCFFGIGKFYTVFGV